MARNRHITADLTGSERWAVLPWYEAKYEISDHGHVRIRQTQQLLTQRLHYSRRYPVVELCHQGKHRETLVHRLVLTAFRGEPPDGTECRHLNGIRTDNRLDNLEWGTHKENCQDQLGHGTHPCASKTHCKRGHEFTEENTYWRSVGHRTCLACKRLMENRRYHRRRAEGFVR